MRSARRSSSIQRSATFETFEQRLAFSAQPIPELWGSDAPQAQVAPLPAPNDDAFVPLLLSTPPDAAGTAVETWGASSSASSDDALAAFGLDGTGQTVAIIDSGIAYDHVALGGGWGAGYQVVGGWDFAEQDGDPYDDGPFGFHGTHVAGILGSSDARHPGLTPGADLVALRVFDDNGVGSFDWVEQALHWVHENRDAFTHPITTVNLSLGSSENLLDVPDWATLEDEFAQLDADGIFVAVAAGNRFREYAAPGLSYPGSSPYVIAAASVDNDGSLSDFSQRVSGILAAPGRSIVSTVPDYVFGADGYLNDFGASSGTSMAAPYVAGASVLVRQALERAGYGDITQATIAQYLRDASQVRHDATTGALYYQIDVAATLRTILPAAGDAAASDEPRPLGLIRDGARVNGTLARPDDREYFTFTAGADGTFRIASQDRTPGGLQLGLVDGDAVIGTAEISFVVKAGHEYTIFLQSGTMVGDYELNLLLLPASHAVDLGTSEMIHVENLPVENGWFRVEAARSATLTAIVSGTDHPEVRVYDRHLNLIGTDEQATAARVDVDAIAGEVYFIYIAKASDRVAMTVANVVANDGGRVQLYGTSGDDTFDLLGGAETAMSINGVTYSFVDVQAIRITADAGEDAVRVAGLGTVSLQLEGVEQLADVDALAYSLSHDLRLKSGGSDWHDWGGWGERWISSKNADWYFITPDGAFYRWNGGYDLSTSTRIATLDGRYHKDLSLLVDAPTTELMHAQEAAVLDAQLDLSLYRHNYNNWGGWSERWVRAADQQWYFITPDGDFYRWDGSGDLSSSSLVTRLTADFHTDLSRLYEAGASPLLTSAARLDAMLGLSAPATYYNNWGGWNERWITADNGDWYFITPSGGLYQWQPFGTDLSRSQLVARLSTYFHEDPAALHDAMNARVAATMGRLSEAGASASHSDDLDVNARAVTSQSVIYSESQWAAATSAPVTPAPVTIGDVLQMWGGTANKVTSSSRGGGESRPDPDHPSQSVQDMTERRHTSEAFAPLDAAFSEPLSDDLIDLLASSQLRRP